MEHLLLKAATTATTDQGEFTALAAAYSVDRVKDRIVPGAFKATIERWQQSGKRIPLHWNHEGDAKSIIGSIDPAAMRETDEGLYVEGKLDIADSETAREAWRSMKNGSMSLSFGYLVDKSKKAKDGITDLLAIDLFEVSIVPAPANADTRILSTKAAERVAASVQQMAADDLRKEAARVAREAEEAKLPHVPPLAPHPIAQAAVKTWAEAETITSLADSVDSFSHDGLVLYARAITLDEHQGVKTGEIKAVWSAAYVNNLPDSAFLHIEPGGQKDNEGKTTPRSLRHFPVKDADGNIDLPHLRNALARIPQSNLSDTVKERLTSMAQRIFDAQKSMAGRTDQEPTTARSVDPLRKRADAIAFEFATSGLPTKPPHNVAPPPPEPELSLKELKQRMRDEMLTHLSGETT